VVFNKINDEYVAAVNIFEVNISGRLDITLGILYLGVVHLLRNAFLGEGVFQKMWQFVTGMGEGFENLLRSQLINYFFEILEIFDKIKPKSVKTWFHNNKFVYFWLKYIKILIFFQILKAWKLEGFKKFCSNF